MPAHALRAIITRPGQEADAWVAQIEHHGISALALPMIDIVAVPDRTLLTQAWKDLAQYDALMFVSSNAVSHFFCGAAGRCHKFVGVGHQGAARLGYRARQPRGIAGARGAGNAH